MSKQHSSQNNFQIQRHNQDILQQHEALLKNQFIE